MKFYTITEFRKMCGVTPQTLRNWDRSGYLKPHHTAPNGFRYYSEDQVNQLTGKLLNPRKVIGYCRVLSRKYAEDLQKQVDAVTAYLTAQGKPFEIISDVGSGLNFNKSGINKLIQLIEDNKVEKVTMLHKSTIAGFNWGLMKAIAELHDTQLEVIQPSTELAENEFVDNLTQVLAYFSDRQSNVTKHMIATFVKDWTKG